MYPGPFAPIYTTNSSGQSISGLATTTVTPTAGSAVSGKLGGNVNGDSQNVDVLIVNTSSVLVTVTLGDGSQAAATASNGIPIVPNMPYVVRVPATANSVSVFLAAAATAGTVYFVRGLGG